MSIMRRVRRLIDREALFFAALILIVAALMVAVTIDDVSQYAVERGANALAHK